MLRGLARHIADEHAPSGHKIVAVKCFREITGLSLADAKKAIEEYWPATPAAGVAVPAGNTNL